MALKQLFNAKHEGPWWFADSGSKNLSVLSYLGIFLMKAIAKGSKLLLEEKFNMYYFTDFFLIIICVTLMPKSTTPRLKLETHFARHHISCSEKSTA